MFHQSSYVRNENGNLQHVISQHLHIVFSFHIFILVSKASVPPRYFQDALGTAWAEHCLQTTIRQLPFENGDSAHSERVAIKAAAMLDQRVWDLFIENISNTLVTTCGPQYL